MNILLRPQETVMRDKEDQQMSGIMKCLIAITMLLALVPMGLADAQAGADSTAAGKGQRRPNTRAFQSWAGSGCPC